MRTDRRHVAISAMLAIVMCGAAVLGMFVAPEPAHAVDWSSSAYRSANIFWQSNLAPSQFYDDGRVTLSGAAGNCTWYAWGRIRELGYTGSDLNYLNGAAGTWGGKAAGHFTVNTTPAAGTVAESSGHVAVVERVNSDGSLLISESSWYYPTVGQGSFLYRTRTTSRTEFLRFIHIHDLDVPVHYNPIAPGDSGFAKYGSSAGWTPIGGGLYGTGIYTVNGGGTRDNYARWTFDLSKINGTRKYKAEAYVTSTHAGTTSADYHINTASGLVHKSVNQLVLSNQWANLGSYSFASGSTWFELDDVTGEAAFTKEIAFDAIRLTPYFNLKYSAGTGGTISGTATQSILKGADGTKVTAVPKAGYRFVKWSDGKTTAARTDLDVVADKTVSASFAAVVVPSVHRFYNTRLGVHFYTADEAEKTSTINNLGGTYTYEGVAYGVNAASNTQPLHRFYNKRVGVHFYTASETEKANTINNLGDTYTYEGVAYNVSAANAAGRTAVHRFYNKRTGTHFYTSDGAEKQNIQNTLGSIYTYEGVGFYLAP